jgi:hypothetical protein
MAYKRSSYCFLEILLSPQQESENDPAGALRYSAEAVRCRIGPAPARSVLAEFVRTEDGSTHCA